MARKHRRRRYGDELVPAMPATVYVPRPRESKVPLFLGLGAVGAAIYGYFRWKNLLKALQPCVMPQTAYPIPTTVLNIPGVPASAAMLDGDSPDNTGAVYDAQGCMLGYMVKSSGGSLMFSKTAPAKTVKSMTVGLTAAQAQQGCVAPKTYPAIPSDMAAALSAASGNQVPSGTMVDPSTGVLYAPDPTGSFACPVATVVVNSDGSYSFSH